MLLAVVLPLPGTPAAVLLGAASVIGAVQHRGKLNVRVAVSSPRLSDRLWYDHLVFGAQRLAGFVPRARIAAHGALGIADGTKRQEIGRLYVTSRVDRLDGVASELEGLSASACSGSGPTAPSRS